MNNLISPYDLGSFPIVENCHKIRVEDLVSKIQRELKTRLLESQIEVLGVDVKLTTSKTRFNGDRLWFVCPICGKKVGTLFKHSLLDLIGCRICLGMRYKKQRFKGMLEDDTRY